MVTIDIRLTIKSRRKMVIKIKETKIWFWSIKLWQLCVSVLFSTDSIIVLLYILPKIEVLNLCKWNASPLIYYRYVNFRFLELNYIKSIFRKLLPQLDETFFTINDGKDNKTNNVKYFFYNIKTSPVLVKPLYETVFSKTKAKLNLDLVSVCRILGYGLRLRS
jgi:hypothetical protein